MSIVNSFSSGTTISSSAMNANFSDIASEITNSVAKDGQTSMTGPLKASSGTVSAPGVTFASDTDTGFYRKSSGTIGVVCDGSEIGTLSSNGFSATFPAGTVMLFMQTAAPTGWTKSTAHNDKALRIVSGTASSGGGSTFSAVFAARIIAEANLPAHTHTFSATTGGAGAHTHTISLMGTASDVATTGGGFRFNNSTGTKSTDDPGNHTHTVSGTTGVGSGSGTAMDFAVAYADVIAATKD